MDPIRSPLVEGFDRYVVIKSSIWRYSAARVLVVDRERTTPNAPLSNTLSTIHPWCRVEREAVTVKGRHLIKEVQGVNN